jgi:hypothetical protein
MNYDKVILLIYYAFFFGVVSGIGISFGTKMLVKHKSKDSK